METYWLRYDAICDVWVPVEASSPEDAARQFMSGAGGSRRQVTLEPVIPNPFSVYDCNRKFIKAVDFDCEEIRRQEKEYGREVIALKAPMWEDAGFLDEETGEANCRVMNQAPGLELKPDKKPTGLWERIKRRLGWVKRS